jgi:S-DNA-T family DNA segregation ATPase FtsK/SpoIIIE
MSGPQGEVQLALVEDIPSSLRMYRDERVSLAGYEREPIDEVAGELTTAASLLAKCFEGLSSTQLGRRCIYNFPEPTERDIAWLGRHSAHEATHHLQDVQSGLERLWLGVMHPPTRP